MGQKDDFATLVENLKATDTRSKKHRYAIASAFVGMLGTVLITAFLLMIAIGIFKHVFDPDWLQTTSYLETLALYVAWIYVNPWRREN